MGQKTETPPTSFDQYTSSQSYREAVATATKFIKQDPDFFLSVKVNYLTTLIEKHLGALHNLTLLDVGCGVGFVASELIPQVKKYHGVDIPKAVVREARATNPNGDFSTYNGTELPYKDQTMDVSFAVNVMHHVPPDQWPIFLKEMRRVTKPGGLTVIFEQNPWNPLTRLAVARCVFDADAVLLARPTLAHLFEMSGLTIIEQRFIIFTPWNSQVFHQLDRFLGRIFPIGAQYYITGRNA